MRIFQIKFLIQLFMVKKKFAHAQTGKTNISISGQKNWIKPLVWKRVHFVGIHYIDVWKQ